jgi:hypothetical protein
LAAITGSVRDRGRTSRATGSAGSPRCARAARATASWTPVRHRALSAAATATCSHLCADKPWRWPALERLTACVRPDVETNQLLGIIESLAKVHKWKADLMGSEPSPKATPKPGSDLDGDNAASYPYEVSHAAWMTMMAATDHLTCLEATFFQSGPLSAQMHLHIYAQLTLVRASFENAAQAVWLLQPDERRARILRRLQQEYAEIRELDKVKAEGSQQPQPTRAERLADLAARAQPLGISATEINDGHGYSAMVEAAGERIGIGRSKALLIWKACSALAHGEVRGSLAYLSMRVFDGPSPDMALGQVGGNLTLLHHGVDAAVATLQAAHVLYARRSGHR